MSDSPAMFWDAEVVGATPMLPDVVAVSLVVDAATPMAYAAGQYVRVHLADGRRRDLSMATACGGDNRLELWLRQAGGPFSTYVFSQLKLGDRWRLEGPLGAAGLRDENRPLLVVAGGTGLAPARAIAQAVARDQSARKVQLVAGAHSRDELLAHDELARWARAHPARAYEPVLASPDVDWQGRLGTPDQAVATRTDWHDWVAHVFGPPPMVDAVAAGLRRRGLGADRLRADAFTPGALDLDGHGEGR